jgi:hypothetical protein
MSSRHYFLQCEEKHWGSITEMLNFSSLPHNLPNCDCVLAVDFKESMSFLEEQFLG